MKRVLMLGLAAMGSVSLGICAESTKTPAAAPAAVDVRESGPERRLKTLATKLELSKSQQSAVRKIFEEIRTRDTALRAEMEEKRKAILIDADARITELLKPEQKQKYVELKESEMEIRRLLKDAEGR